MHAIRRWGAQRTITDDPLGSRPLRSAARARAAGTGYLAQNDSSAARSTSPVPGGPLDEQDHPAQAAITELQRDPSVESLKVPQPRLGLDDDRIACSVDDRVERTPVPGGGQRDLYPPAECWNDPCAKSLQQLQMGHVSDRRPSRVEANRLIEADNRGDPGEVAQSHTSDLAALDPGQLPAGGTDEGRDPRQAVSGGEPLTSQLRAEGREQSRDDAVSRVKPPFGGRHRSNDRLGPSTRAYRRST